MSLNIAPTQQERQQHLHYSQLFRPVQMADARLRRDVNPAPAQTTQARNYGIAEALANPVQVQSGGWAEALAEAVALGIRGRISADEFERERSADDAARKQQSAQRSAIAEALANFDPANPSAMVDRLRVAAPEQALQVATQAMRNQQSQAGREQWSEPFTYENGTAQRNLQSNQFRVLTRPPGAGNSRGGNPELPPGFVWED